MEQEQIQASVVYRGQAWGRISSEDYAEAIEALQEAAGQLEPDGANCRVCHDSGHKAWECHHNPLAMAREAAETRFQWRCFHCGEVFTDAVLAEEHFGTRQDPAAPHGAIELVRRYEDLAERCERAETERDRLSALLNTPELEEFDKGAPLEAAHQQERWGAAHDAGKKPEDWFWLIGYLAGKALASMRAGDPAKAKHHCISTAAALRNWHAAIRQGWSAMRPGIATPEV